MATLLDDRPDQEQDTGANPADAYYDQALNPLSKSLHNAEKPGPQLAGLVLLAKKLVGAGAPGRITSAKKPPIKPPKS